MSLYSLRVAMATTIALGGCASAGSPALVYPAQPSAGVRANATQPLPVERTTIVNLTATLGHLDLALKQVKGGSSAVVADDFKRYRGDTMTLVEGPLLPAGVEAPPGAKTVIFLVTLTVNKLTVGTGESLFDFGIPSCPLSDEISTGFYSNGKWTTQQSTCDTLLIFPTWLIFRPKVKYVVAAYTTT